MLKDSGGVQQSLNPCRWWCITGPTDPSRPSTLRRRALCRLTRASGFYLTRYPEDASGYASGRFGREGANVIPAYVSLQNPYALLMLVELVIVMLCSLPVPRSLADTCTMPFASISNVTSICGMPRGAAGMPSRRNMPSDLLSCGISRSPCSTLTSTEG